MTGLPLPVSLGLQVATVAAGASGVGGFVAWFEARLQDRRGPRILQPHFAPAKILWAPPGAGPILVSSTTSSGQSARQIRCCVGDCKERIVLSDPFAAGQSAGFDLTASRAHRQVGVEGVGRLTRAVRAHHAALRTPSCAAAAINSGFGHRSGRAPAGVHDFDAAAGGLSGIEVRCTAREGWQSWTKTV